MIFRFLKENGFIVSIKKIFFHINVILYNLFFTGVPFEVKRNSLFLKRGRYFHYYLKKKIQHAPRYERCGEKTKIIWWCWLQGIDNAPDLCIACLKSVYKYYPDYKIIIIDLNTYNKYVNIPHSIILKYKKGNISNTHFSDLIRVYLLAEYGGTWIDATVLCTKRNEYIMEQPLFLYQTWGRGNCGINSSSWLIVAESKHPIIMLTKFLLTDYWLNHDFLCDYFLMHYIFKEASIVYLKEWGEVPLYSNLPSLILQHELQEKYTYNRYKAIASMADFHKLSYKIVCDSNIYTNYKHIVEGEISCGDEKKE